MNPSTIPFPASVADVQDALAGQNYLAETGLATAIFLALRLGRPLFLEGEAGVGKTEVAKALAALLGRRLIRLQCYEGLDAAAALYEWNYAAQLLHIRIAEAGGPLDAAREAALRRDLFSRDFLLRRPLLQAIDPAERAGGEDGKDGADGAPVLLIDELDRADEEFEAFLLEVLSDFQVTIPELGVIKAPSPPVVVITSNRTREVHDALKRRCLYAWIDYPSFEKEYAIVLAKAPHLPEELTRQIVEYVQRLRAEELYKPPGVAETLDWANALAALDARVLDVALVEQTLGVLLKHRDDIDLARARL